MVLHQSTDLTILSLTECGGRIVISMCVRLQRGRKSEELQVVPQVPDLPLNLMDLSLSPQLQLISQSLHLKLVFGLEL